MNVNEVVANIALQNAGKEKGDYSFVNPNDHVNLVRRLLYRILQP